MRINTFTALMDIHSRWPSECGKIIQSLLAISFGPPRGGFVVENRISEGIDLELSDPQKFAIEVKTTESNTVVLSEKDISGLRAKFKNDGYIPAVAALRLQLSADWVISSARNLDGRDLRLCAEAYTCERLALNPIQELQEIAQREFETTVAELRDGVLSPPNGSPLDYLRHVLQMENAKPAADIGKAVGHASTALEFTSKLFS